MKHVNLDRYNVQVIPQCLDYAEKKWAFSNDLKDNNGIDQYHTKTNCSVTNDDPPSSLQCFARSISYLRRSFLFSFGTSLLFITSDQVAACPDAASAATLHTAVDLTDGFAFYTNVADIFSYPNHTNITVNNVDLQFLDERRCLDQH